MRDESLAAVILAAGLGTRMRSRTPKVLHPIAGKPMVDYVLDACSEAGVQRIVVILNPNAPEVVSHIGGRAEVAFQEHPNGSGDALAKAPPDVLGHGDVLVLNGDAPLVRPETLRALVEFHHRSRAAATLASVIDPSRDDGRVVRDDDRRFERIVEASQANGRERALTEVNVGLYCFRGGSELMQALAMLEPRNAAGELFLTDTLARLRPVEVMRMDDVVEAKGINDRVQLAAAEAAARARVVERLMLGGVTVIDPATTFVDATVRVGMDTVIEPFTFLRGESVIGENCRIGPYSDIRDSRVADGCRVEHSWLDRVRMAEGSDCGPFAKLRPGTEIGMRVHVGSFAEIVRSRVGAGSAVPHFSYLGDTTVGQRVNIGAGTVTANYDGVNKNPTDIGDDSFVGVGSMLVAPRKVGRRAKTGAGAVVTRDVPDDTLAVGVPARAIRKLRAGRDR